MPSTTSSRSAGCRCRSRSSATTPPAHALMAHLDRAGHRLRRHPAHRPLQHADEGAHPRRHAALQPAADRPLRHRGHVRDDRGRGARASPRLLARAMPVSRRGAGQRLRLRRRRGRTSSRSSAQRAQRQGRSRSTRATTCSAIPASPPRRRTRRKPRRPRARRSGTARRRRSATSRATLQQGLDCEAVLITRGSRGMALLERDAASRCSSRCPAPTRSRTSPAPATRSSPRSRSHWRPARRSPRRPSSPTTPAASW